MSCNHASKKLIDDAAVIASIASASQTMPCQPLLQVRYTCTCAIRTCSYTCATHVPIHGPIHVPHMFLYMCRTYATHVRVLSITGYACVRQHAYVYAEIVFQVSSYSCPQRKHNNVCYPSTSQT